MTTPDSASDTKPAVSDAEAAKSSLWGWGAIAMFALVIGGIFVGVGYPHTDTTGIGLGAYTEEHGNGFVFILGLFLSALGSLALSVVTVAMGVSYGNRLSRR